MPTISIAVLPEEGVAEGLELAEGKVELREEEVELREDEVELREEEVELREGKAELAEAEVKLVGYVAAGYVWYEELTPSSTTGVVPVGTV